MRSCFQTESIYIYPKLDERYISIGNYLLHSEDQSDKRTRSFIVYNSLSILRTILRSRSSMKMDESFDIKSKYSVMAKL